MDTKYLDGIRSGDTETLREIYREYYPAVRRLIRNNNGSDEDARDIFQEAIVIVYNKLQSDTFQLSSSLKTFMYAVCRNLWLNTLKRRGRREFNPDPDKHYGEIDDGIVGEIERRERQLLFRKHFANLSEQCRHILGMFFDGMTMRQIAEAIGSDSEDYVKTKKYKCKKTLMDAIKKDPLFREMVSADGR